MSATNGFLRQVESRLDVPPGVKSGILRELESHLTELHEELIALGMGCGEARREAEKRLGDPADLAARLSAAHNTASWKSTILCAAPFAASALLLFIFGSRSEEWLPAASVALLGAITGAVSVRELLRGRRPVWLATWLATALLCGLTVLREVSAHVIEVRLVWQLLAATAASAFLLVALIPNLKRFNRLTRAFTLCSLFFVLCSACVLYRRLESGGAVPLGFSMLYLVMPVLAVVYGKSVFKLHPYGSGELASLFLLTVFTLDLPSPLGTPHGIYLTFGSLAGGMAVAWFARAARSALKGKLICWALWFASLASAAALAAEYPFGPAAVQVFGVLIGSLLYMGYLFLFVTWTIDSRHEEAADTPAVAQ